MRVFGGMMVAMVLATTAQAADMPNTNLVCDGTQDIGKSGGPKKTTKFHEVYRIDYQSKRWCDGKCESPLDILSYDDETIALMFSSLGSLLISRTKGTVQGLFKLPLGDGTTSVQIIEATCKPQPFTGVQPPPPGPKPVPKF